MFNLAVKEAYDAKQEAYKAMDEARNKVRELNGTINSMFVEIEQMQADYDVVNSGATEAWEKYKQTLDSIDERIADVNLAIMEAKDLKEQFQRKADEDSTSYRKRLYQDAIALFNEQGIQLNKEKEAMITEKRNVKKPQTPDRNSLLAALKAKRAKHAEATREYHTVKEDLAKKRIAFKQAQNKYYEMKNAERVTFEEKEDAKKIEALKSANIPEEFWDSATVDYGETETHIYYGGDESHAHGHVVLRKNAENFVRKPHKFNMKIS
jgi:hypothetical protein